MSFVKGLAHVALMVADLDRSLAFYTKVFGFEEMMRINNDAGEVWLVYLRITDTVYLEIFPQADSDQTGHWNANGINHLCLEVEDIEAAVADLEAKGVVLTQALSQAVDGNWQAWCADPDGNRIELMQMSPDCLQLQAIARLRASREKA